MVSFFWHTAVLHQFLGCNTNVRWRFFNDRPKLLLQFYTAIRRFWCQPVVGQNRYSLGFITTGINDLPGYHLYSMGQVYPNPANTVLHVPLDIPHATAAPATNGLAGNYLYVFDMQGRQLMQQKVQPGNGTAQLDVSTLAPGTYSMVLVAEGYSISHQKFVVLR